jgi:hypothetical protein
VREMFWDSDPSKRSKGVNKSKISEETIDNLPYFNDILFEVVNGKTDSSKLRNITLTAEELIWHGLTTSENLGFHKVHTHLSQTRNGWEEFFVYIKNVTQSPQKIYHSRDARMQKLKNLWAQYNSSSQKIPDVALICHDLRSFFGKNPLRDLFKEPEDKMPRVEDPASLDEQLREVFDRKYHYVPGALWWYRLNPDDSDLMNNIALNTDHGKAKGDENELLRYLQD